MSYAFSFSAPGVPAWPAQERLPKISVQSANPVQAVDPWWVVDAVCDAFFVSHADLIGKDRHKSIAHARQVAFWLVRKLCFLSYPQIGRFFGGRDHTTIMSGISRIERQLQKDPGYRARLELLAKQLEEKAKGAAA